MCAPGLLVYLVVEALSFLLLSTHMTIHPVVTATSSAASTAMKAPSITGLLLVSPVAVLVMTVPTAVDISLLCVDCRQFVGVMLEYSVMTVVGNFGALVANGRRDEATRRGEHVGVMVTARGVWVAVTVTVMHGSPWFEFQLHFSLNWFLRSSWQISVHGSVLASTIPVAASLHPIV